MKTKCTLLFIFITAFMGISLMQQSHLAAGKFFADTRAGAADRNVLTTEEKPVLVEEKRAKRKVIEVYGKLPLSFIEN